MTKETFEEATASGRARSGSRPTSSRYGTHKKHKGKKRRKRENVKKMRLSHTTTCNAGYLDESDYVAARETADEQKSMKLLQMVIISCTIYLVCRHVTKR